MSGPGLAAAIKLLVCRQLESLSGRKHGPRAPGCQPAPPIYHQTRAARARAGACGLPLPFQKHMGGILGSGGNTRGNPPCGRAWAPAATAASATGCWQIETLSTWEVYWRCCFWTFVGLRCRDIRGRTTCFRTRTPVVHERGLACMARHPPRGSDKDQSQVWHCPTTVRCHCVCMHRQTILFADLATLSNLPRWSCVWWACLHGIITLRSGSLSLFCGPMHGSLWVYCTAETFARCRRSREASRSRGLAPYYLQRSSSWWSGLWSRCGSTPLYCMPRALAPSGPLSPSPPGTSGSGVSLQVSVWVGACPAQECSSRRDQVWGG